VTFKTLLLLAIACALVIPLVGGEGESGGPPAEFRSPMRIAQATGKNLLVTDHELKRVIEIKSRTLEEVNSFIIDGKPLGVAYLDEKVYVGNVTRRRVEVFTRAGELLYDLGGPLAEVLQPTDIAVDASSSLIFVVDGLARMVKIFDVGVSSPTGNLIGTIPPMGPDPLVLSKPTGIAVDLVRSEVLVCDYGDDAMGTDPRIQIFDYSGNLVYTILGKLGWFSSRFSRPQGLAIYDDSIFMTESLIGQVLVLDRNTGATLRTFGTYGTGPGELSLPLDLVLVGNRNDVFLTNNAARRIEVFPSEGMVP
jgi:DNA-binding beta-propeller fold protein YncE